MVKKARKPRDPESTLKGRLALMTEDRDQFQAQCKEHLEKIAGLEYALRSKEERFIAYKRKVEESIRWYQCHIQVLVSKIPAGPRT